MKNIHLSSISDLHEDVEATLALVIPMLGKLLPYAKVHHIGATAITGSISKGDLDLLVQVSPKKFPLAINVLKKYFDVKQPANWTKEFASFGNDDAYPLPLGIQVVIEESSMDFFLFLRDYFNSKPDAVESYNALKREHAADGGEAYWQAKNAFLEKILASRNHSK